VPIKWSEIEPYEFPQGVYQWAHADAAIAAVREGCVALIVTFESALARAGYLIASLTRVT
jgi:hypothetical protein